MSALSRSGDRASVTGPPPSLPTVARSFISVVRATRQPPLTSPSRWSSGTRTPDRKTSLKSLPPVIWRSDRTSTYGHTQETLRGLFAGVSDEVRERITSGTFNELFQVPVQTPAQASV